MTILLNVGFLLYSSNENKIMSYLYSYFYTDSLPPSTSSGFPLSFRKERGERPPYGRWGEYI
jgi:hypothetical protein